MKLILSFFISIICSCCLAQATEKRTTVAKINTSPPTVKKEEPGTLGFIFGLDTKNPDTIAVKILYVFAGSAADEAELGAGTLIDAINGHQLVNETVQDIAKLLSGNIGTQVVLSVRKGLFSSKTDITLTRKKTPQYPVLENYKKAVVAYQQYDYASAVQLFKKAGDYPDARLMLALIYGGISPIPDTKNPEFYKKREQLRSFTNIDSAKTYMNQLLIEGYPGASYAMYYNCLVMNGSAFYKNYARYDTYNHRGISNYWLYESAANDHLPAQEELINKITSDKNDEGFSHDKNEAMYWYKRAMAAGYQKGNELLAKINKMPAKDYHFIHFEDVQKMTQIAHLYKEDKFNYKGVSDLCPFGIRGCISGYYSDYGFDDAFKLDWYTYYIADHNDAVQIFDAAAKDMKSYFSGAEWYTINEYMHSKPEKSLLAKFSVTETDGKKYNMQLGMILQQNNQGYYIVFIYEEAP